MGANFEGANLTNAILDRADFSNTNLKNAKLVNSVITGATFTDANLENVDFEDSLIGSVCSSLFLLQHSQVVKMSNACVKIQH